MLRHHIANTLYQVQKKYIHITHPQKAANLNENEKIYERGKQRK